MTGHIRGELLAAVMLLAGVAAADARTMRVMESLPAAQAIMSGASEQFSIRFDGPVDHAGSRLFITQGQRLVQTLHPLLTAEPNTLYAAVGSLPSGDYELHWVVKAPGEPDMTEGSLPFSVRR
jgi:methionine-rich copper-binding protein CopC